MKKIEILYYGLEIDINIDEKLFNYAKRFWYRYQKATCQSSMDLKITINIISDYSDNHNSSFLIRNDDLFKTVIYSNQFNLSIDYSFFPKNTICNCIVYVSNIENAFSFDATFSAIMFETISRIQLKRGVFPLHASSICKNGDSYVFFGFPGAGKTVTALRLLKYGYAIQSDDRSFITTDGITQSLVRPIHINNNLDIKKQLLDLFEDKSEIKSVHRGSYIIQNKYVEYEEQHLKGFFFLERTDKGKNPEAETSIERLTRMDGISKLLSNQYAWYTKREIDLFFSWLIALRIPIYKMKYGVTDECMKKIASILMKI